MRVNDFGPHTHSIFRGGDLYVRATYTRVYTVRTQDHTMAAKYYMRHPTKAAPPEIHYVTRRYS